MYSKWIARYGVQTVPFPGRSVQKKEGRTDVFVFCCRFPPYFSTTLFKKIVNVPGQQCFPRQKKRKDCTDLVIGMPMK